MLGKRTLAAEGKRVANKVERPPVGLQALSCASRTPTPMRPTTCVHCSRQVWPKSSARADRVVAIDEPSSRTKTERPWRGGRQIAAAASALTPTTPRQAHKKLNKARTKVRDRVGVTEQSPLPADLKSDPYLPTAASTPSRSSYSTSGRLEIRHFREYGTDFGRIAVQLVGKLDGSDLDPPPREQCREPGPVSSASGLRRHNSPACILQTGLSVLIGMWLPPTSSTNQKICCGAIAQRHILSKNSACDFVATSVENNF